MPRHKLIICILQHGNWIFHPTLVIAPRRRMNMHKLARFKNIHRLCIMKALLNPPGCATQKMFTLFSKNWRAEFLIDIYLTRVFFSLG